jgi:hypothetical protein
MIAGLLHIFPWMPQAVLKIRYGSFTDSRFTVQYVWQPDCKLM